MTFISCSKPAVVPNPYSSLISCTHFHVSRKIHHGIIHAKLGKPIYVFFQQKSKKSFWCFIKQIVILPFWDPRRTSFINSKYGQDTIFLAPKWPMSQMQLICWVWFVIVGDADGRCMENNRFSTTREKPEK